ncbi:putative PurR-regulated permease PerM [Isoptericola jiangsuensis]|uniref:Putative PurR-regulated permease PerM n=1 Tax=Isoptericola jiangsuensis TaxID=548579 RepID=A0A2A9EVZ4_9MICO|nr:AI-2E family transporter [Isoptericola jiangsuensis]PFG43058.1 putative PurR-regulated permease PerM [Isoptericola jiangsuensis]
MVEARENVPQWLRTSAGWSWRLVALVVGLSLVVYATAQVELVFVAVFLALVLTSVFRPLANVYDRVMPRPLATVLSLLTGVVVFGGLMTFVVASVAGQWTELAGQFDTGLQQILEYLQHLPFGLSVTGDQLNEWVQAGGQWLSDNAETLASRAAESAGSVLEALMVIALAIFCTIFFVNSGDRIWSWFVHQLPVRNRRRLREAAGAGWYTFSGFARGTVIIAFSDGILAFVLLSILGVPLAAPLAVLVLIGAFIPLIGAPLAMIIAAVVALAAEGVVTALIVTIGIALIGQLEGHVLQPLIMGKQVSLHPVVVAIAVFAGTVLAGILGAVVAVPLVAVVWTVFSTLRGDQPVPLPRGAPDSSDSPGDPETPEVDPVPAGPAGAEESATGDRATGGGAGKTT